jgi:FkbH-like protein
LRDGWFDTVEVTTEDRHRPSRYAEELARKDFLHSFDSLADYLRELEVSVTVAVATEPEIARVSQLTLRTNQFNLTTERLQPAQVRALTENPDAFVVSVHAGDRFGENGLVGAVLGHRERTTVYLDNFLLSCRVFSRGVEQAALSALLGHALASGATEVVGTYRKTAKNTKVRDFYPRNGFTTIANDGTTATFRHDLAAIAPPPDHVRLTLALGRTTA